MMKKKYVIPATEVVGLRYASDMMDNEAQFTASKTSYTNWGGRAKSVVVTNDDAENSSEAWGDTYNAKLWDE